MTRAVSHASRERLGCEPARAPRACLAGPASRGVPLLIAAFLTACSSDPAFVYVPMSAPQAEVTASASALSARVGESVTLHAARRTRAGWKRVARKDVPEGRCWLVREAPADEPEVAGNLHWLFTPDGHQRLNIDFRPDGTRTLSFDKPGSYSVQGRSHIWCGEGRSAYSNTLTIDIRP